VLNLIVLYDTTSFGVLSSSIVNLVLLTGGGILGTIHLAILRERMAEFIQLNVASHSPMVNYSSLVIRVFLYTLSFNTYGSIPIGIPIFTIPRLSFFISISI
jgi:hypothetical protein